MKHKIYKESMHFYEFIFIEKNWLIGTILIVLHNKLQKKKFKNSFIWKSYFGDKIHVILM
jgi:hypothetical protein